MALVALAPMVVRVWQLGHAATLLSLVDPMALSGAAVVAFILVLNFLAAPAQIHAEQERRIAALEAARTSKLALEFDRDDPACVMPIRNIEPHATLYRVRVTNLSNDCTMEGVQVKLTDLQPLAVPYLPAPLLFMHEPPTVREVSLHPQQSAYVDVVQQADVGGPLLLWHTVLGQEHSVTALGDFALTLTAFAHGMPPAFANFCVLVERSRRARFDVWRDQELRPWTF